MRRPNILIFMTDQQQAQVIKPEHPCLTPNIDKLIKKGIRFTSAYTPMAHCCPARASFMTGLYPSQHGIHNNVLNEQALNKSLKSGVETFSEKLKDAGYSLYYSGKWHVSATEDPKDRGWEELEVTSLGSRGDYNGTSLDIYRKLKGLRDKKERDNGEILRPGWGHIKLYGTSDKRYEELHDYKIVSKAVNELSELKNTEKPWCMYVGVSGPHDPFIVPEKYANMYNPDEIELPPNYRDNLLDKPAVYRRMRKVWAQLTDREVRESIAHYWGYCTMMDDMFGELVKKLEDTDQIENTMIVYLSDHGEHCGAHGLYCKGISHFDEGYRIPCVVSWPSEIKEPGRVVDDFVTLMDFAPTFIEAASAPELSKCAGRSLIPFLRNEAVEGWRDHLFTQCNGVEVYYTQRVVRTKRYKFVYNPTDIDELYDLEIDPHEMNNIIDHPGMGHIKEMMIIKMWECVYDTDDTIFNNYGPVATAEIGPGIF